MNTQKSMIYGVALALTILIWFIALKMAGHSQPGTMPVLKDSNLSNEKSPLEKNKDSSDTLTKTLNDTISGLKQKQKTKKPSLKKNETQIETPSYPIEKIRFTTQVVPSQKADLSFGLEVVIQTNVIIPSPHIRIECDGPVGDAKFRFTTSSVMLTVQTVVEGNNFDFSCGFPDFTPQNVLIITLFSKTKISVVRVLHI